MMVMRSRKYIPIFLAPPLLCPSFSFATFLHLFPIFPPFVADAVEVWIQEARHIQPHPSYFAANIQMYIYCCVAAISYIRSKCEATCSAGCTCKYSANPYY